MKLREIKLTNFRQFHGQQHLMFASGDGDKNVTVIHGFNGSGKTALLNAFVWCLYGETTPDLEAKDRLANERALAEAVAGSPVEVSVRLSFVVRGETFTVERKAFATRTATEEVRETKPSLGSWRAGANGEWERFPAGAEGGSEASTELFVEQLLPRELYPFFFFNGERVERLASADAYSRVEGGVKQLLNIEIFERSARHIREWTSADLSKELKQLGNTEMTDAVEDEERIQKDIGKIGEVVALHRANIAASEARIEAIEQKQSGLVELTTFTLKRDEVRAKQVATKDQLYSTDKDLARKLSRDGYLAFAGPVLAAARDQIAQARKRGELPIKLKPQFVDDLLEKKSCICGRPIPKGSKEETCLVAWRESNGLAALEEAISQLGAHASSLSLRGNQFSEDLSRLVGEKSVLLAKRRAYADEEDVLNSKIGGRDVSEDAAKLEASRQDSVRARDDEHFALKQEETKLADLRATLEDVQKRIKRLQTEDGRVKLIQRQKTAVDRVAAALDEICEIQKQDVRKDLTEEVSKIWDDAAVKDYRASVTEDFRLTLSKRVGGVLQPVHGASTGEKQILALSFVGSLVRRARQNGVEDSSAGIGASLVTGGDYPLVMDSPFGTLERDYQRKVGEWIPKLASQVIVMVSKSQWSAEVESAMRSRVGKEYILELQTSKEDAAKHIEVAGRSYPYVVSSHEATEQTAIREVSLGS